MKLYSLLTPDQVAKTIYLYQNDTINKSMAVYILNELIKENIKQILETHIAVDIQDDYMVIY